MNSNFAALLKNRLSTVKPVYLLASVFSLALSATAISPMLAQTSAPTQPTGRHQVRQQNPLNLTADQQAKLKQIRQAEKAQMDNILTAEQKARLAAARQNHQNPRQVFDSLNLSADQKSQIEALHRSTKQQMDALLTAEQRQQMQQHRPGPGGEHHENWLKLTSDQQAKLQQIRQAEKTQMDNILTTEQKAQLAAARQNHQNPRQVFDSLNLSADQKAQIEALHRSTKQQMDALLTAEQRQQVQQHRPHQDAGAQPAQ